MRVSVRFGLFTLDTDRRLLQRNDVDVHLTPKAFDLLVLLIQEAPRVLRKTELHERLWPGTFVSDATLVGLIKEIRRALDDRDATSRLIRTAFGVGYAFCGDASSNTGPPPGRRQPDIGGQSWWIVAGSRNIPLCEGEHVVGRDPASTVWLDVPGVSRRHARIVIDRPGASIEDLESKNGTMVRDQLVEGPSALHDGDCIQVGPILVVFHISASVPLDGDPDRPHPRSLANHASVDHYPSRTDSPKPSVRNRDGGMLLARHASSSARSGSSMPSVVSWNVPKCMPTLSDASRSRCACTASAGFM